MSALDTTATIIAIVGGVIGAIGGTVGIVTSIRTSRRETQRQMDEDNEFSFRAAFIAKQHEVGPYVGQIITDFDVGSREWRGAEKMVERGVLERGPDGKGYRLPGMYVRRRNLPR